MPTSFRVNKVDLIDLNHDPTCKKKLDCQAVLDLKYPKYHFKGLIAISLFSYSSSKQLCKKVETQHIDLFGILSVRQTFV